MKNEEVMKAIKIVSQRPKTEVEVWLQNYLRGNGFSQEPRFNVPYDPDGSPGLYLLEMIRQLYDVAEQEHSKVSVPFADAAVALLQKMVSSEDVFTDSDANYVVDLMWILWDLTPAEPETAVKTLTLIKNDQRFEINERGSSIRPIVLRALLEQILQLSEDKQDKALLATVHEELAP